MKGSKMSCYFSGAEGPGRELLCAGCCTILQAVTHGQDLVPVCGELGCHSKNQTPSRWEDPWRLMGLGCVGRAGGRCRWGFLSPTVGFMALALGLRALF